MERSKKSKYAYANCSRINFGNLHYAIQEMGLDQIFLPPARQNMGRKRFHAPENQFISPKHVIQKKGAPILSLRTAMFT